MPDDDRIPRSLTAPWKRVLRSLKNRRPAQETADAVTSALAATIRSVRDVPDLPGIAARMQEAAASGEVVQSRLPGSGGAQRRYELALSSPPQAALLLAKKVIAGLAYHYGFDRIGPVLAAEGAYNTRELQEQFAEILDSDQVSKLAKMWLAKPSGEGLRAPGTPAEGPAFFGRHGQYPHCRSVMTIDQSVPRATAQLIAPGDPPRPVEFGHRAVLDGKAVTRRLARELSPIAADLIEIATTVYVADQMAARPSRRELDEGVSWARDLSLEIAVRMPDVWNAHAAGLSELLEWLTDDTWGLTFTQRMGRRGPLDVSQGFLFDTIPHGAAPVLFSGGLDSAAGLATWLAKTEAVAVSVDTNNWMQHVQQRVLSGLNAVSAHTCVPLRYRVSTHGQKHPAESTQRSRGLLFLAVGIATAWTLGHDQLQVFENGVGAVNLPYTLAQFRSQASKAMHPKTIRMAQKLASAISGRPFRIDAPGMNLTTAQLIQMAPAAADGALASSVSCDTGFSARVPRHAPCGTCTSCILRRQSLHSAGKAHLDTGAGYRTSSLEGSFAFQTMLWQVSRLRACLDSEDPWRDLVLQYPELLDTSPLTPTEVIGLYRSYVQEWDDFPEALQIGRTAAL